MLFQEECGGLQVEDLSRPGIFVDATPMKNALVINVGDLLMRWSNDHAKSTMHRITILLLQEEPSSGGGEMMRARYSISYFVSPDPTAVIKCLPVCASKKNPAKYEPVPVLQGDYPIAECQTAVPGQTGYICCNDLIE